MWGKSLAMAVMAQAVVAAAVAAEPAPEIQRPVGAAQAVGAVHTLRQIPEACVRLEGVFTGDAADPYRFDAVRTSPTCQPRARFVDAAQAQPSVATGWKFNDLVRVPDAACPARMAVVKVWRRPKDNQQAPDGQGQTRVYLEQARQAAAAGKLGEVPLYTAQLELQGRCGG